ncbi:hypothetical protein Q4503_16460 [Colwellia sp. 6_MG-2023]|uniref:hypothetical protein n=1 Tax=Colwellia sp. 6_MG-2023 TaxID=3062676 RepID=UPI0026E3DE50|nr:hypothetical protein [Colwellia sp. 6_MG-2023]MDO6489289.1 hypothetical protein [Colwellia sp. 6_MG-2023]
MKKLLFAIISMVLLSACSLSPEEVALKNKELEIYAAAMAKPTIICTSGCEYTDPRRNITLAKETNGWDFANTLVKTTANVAMTAVPYAALGVVAVEGIKSSGGNTYNDGSFNSEANQANQQSAETVNGIKANGNVDQSQHNQNNPTSTTNTDNNSVNDSNNGGNDNSTTTPETIAETTEEAP